MRLSPSDSENGRRVLSQNSQFGPLKLEDDASELFPNDLENLPLSIHLSKVFMQSRATSMNEYVPLYGLTQAEWVDTLPEIPTSLKIVVLQIKDDESIRLLSQSYLDCKEVIGSVWNNFVREAQHLNTKPSLDCVFSPLLTYDLVRYRGGKNSISVQPVMRALVEHPRSLRDVLTANEKSPRYRIELVVEIVGSVYRLQSLEDLVKSDALYPIAHSCLRVASQYCVVTPSVAALQCHLANHLSIRGSYEQASQAYRVALHVQEHLYGVNDLQTVNTLRNLGATYAKAGRYGDALDSFERSLRIVQIACGVAQGIVADIYLNLGAVYSEMGEYEDSISRYEAAMNVIVTSQSMDFAMLAEAHSGLADAHLKVGRFELACNSYRESLSLYEYVPYDSTTLVLRVRERLGQAYGGLGMQAAAMDIYESVLEIKLGVFGEGHPSVADTIHNMGVVLKDMGEFDNAIEHFQRARKMYERSCDYPDTVRIANVVKNLGVVYSQQGNHRKAIEYFQRAIELEKQSGRNELGIASSLNNIGVAYARLGQYQRALMLYHEALGILTRIRGPNHVETAGMIYNLGVTQISLGKPRLAKSHLERSRRIFVSTLGKRHHKSIMVKKLLKSLWRQGHRERRTIYGQEEPRDLFGQLGWARGASRAARHAEG